MNKVYIYKGFERFWHWTQASLIMFLAATGFEIHDTIHIFGFEKAVKFHSFAAIALLALIVFAIFWHATTGEWKQYIPTTKKLKEQVMYYSLGMFKGEHHPTKKTELSKMNPLQRLIYLGFKLILIPIVVISGIMYMMHKTIDENDMVIISEFNLESIATWHTLGAFLLIIFLVVHVYMTTTGHTITSNIKAMMTGWEELEDDEDASMEESRKINNKTKQS